MKVDGCVGSMYDIRDRKQEDGSGPIRLLMIVDESLREFYRAVRY